MLKKPELFHQGYYQTTFSLSDEIKKLIIDENWEELDLSFKKLTSSSGELYQYLRTFHEFQAIEFIISIRDANNPWEEDGIWHDDGSRVFAFSLSLTLDPEEIDGGKLAIRKKGESFFSEIKTPEFGNIILFLTGLYGYEHKIHQVKEGRRIIIAGWCS
jgi:hypothetical protein